VISRLGATDQGGKARRAPGGSSGQEREKANRAAREQELSRVPTLVMSPSEVGRLTV